MPEVKRTRLDVVLPYLLDRLRSVTGLNESTCFLSQLEEMPFDGMADQYLWLRVEDDADELPILQGAGRIDCREDQTVSVTVRTRSGLDQPQQDLYRLTGSLTDATLGHLYMVHLVKDALVTFFPADSQGNLYAVAPLEPRPNRRPRRDKKQTEWLEKTLLFSFSYILDLDQSYQG